MSYGMNDVQECGTPGAVKRHRAQARLCPVCDPPWPGEVSRARDGVPLPDRTLTAQVLRRRAELAVRESA